MNRFFLLFSILAFFSVSASFAQRLDTFSETHAEFIAQLEDHMTAGRQQASVASYRKFEGKFKSGAFSEEEMAMILNTGNRMLAKRMPANPFFNSYLEVLAKVKNTAHADQRFREWHETLNAMLSDTEKNHMQSFGEFLDFSGAFFDTNALRYSETGTSWIPLADDYRIGYCKDGPYLEFEQLDLMAFWKKDSLFIYGTSGRFFPVDQVWRGTGGKVTLERFDPNTDIYVEFPEYNIEMKRSLYEVENARLHYPLYFGTRLVEGRFSDKLFVENAVTGSSYPRFESNDQRLKLNNIGAGIEYTGGFRLHGTTIFGYGSKENPALIRLFNAKEKEVFAATSESFSIHREERIVSQEVGATFYFGADSIYHPSVNMYLNIPLRELELTRDKGGKGRIPFYSSVNGVNIEVDKILVYLDRDSAVIGQETLEISDKHDIYFESLNFFDEVDYRRVQNLSSTNPIAIMKVTAEHEGTNFIQADLFARRINSSFTVDHIQNLLFDMASNGFINYDSDKQLIEVKEKVFLYADAEQGKADYDKLRIRSRTKMVNAALNLNDASILISGVDNIEFSRRQKVAILPDSSQVLLRTNRNLDFDGRLFAGFTTMEGKGFHFDYDRFQIGLDSVKHFDLFVPTGELDKNRQPIALSIDSRIEDLSGVLLIDAPSNKSGREDIAMFPSFQSRGKAYVYFEKEAIRDSAYTRDSFYFQLEPFSLNHLDAFTEIDLQFKGTLISSDIFPDIKETLVLQEDKSLGFLSETPADGLPNYLNKGRFTGKIQLNNNGLTGSGTQHYLKASVDSEDLVFLPTEAFCTAEEFNLEEDRVSQVQVPQVHGEDIDLLWRPYKDSMYITPKEVRFSLFNRENRTLDGTLILTPGGLKGDGLLDWEKASMRSKYFSFGAYTAEADTTDLEIRALNTEKFAMKTENVHGFVDFDTQVGVFKANEDFLETFLPYNQYQTSMNEFDWDMKDETITFKAEEGNVGTFLSTHPDQDSLTFQGAEAFYDLKADELKISGVPFIISADAFIYPDSGMVNIMPGGVMERLENARIVADTINKYHVINRASVNILGKKEYRASGFYEYNIAGREQEIEFADISGTRVGKGAHSEKRVSTRAKGQLTEEDNFYIDHKTKFIGEISFASEDRNLYFDGFAQLDASSLPEPAWFSVNSIGDKKDLVIDFDSPKGYNGVPLETGIFLSRETAQVYPSILMPLKSRRDRQILPVKGVFKYDENHDAFIFGDSTRVLHNTLKGNKLVFNGAEGSVEAEGILSLGSGLKYVSIEAAGKAKTSFSKPASDVIEASDSSLLGNPFALPPVEIEVMAGINLSVPEKLLNLMALDLQSASFDAKDIPYIANAEFYKKAVTDLFPDESPVRDAVEFIGSGFLDLPEKYNPYTLLLSPLKMSWDPDYQSFVSSQPSKVGVVSIGGKPVNKILTCHVEVRMPTNEDDRLYIYLQSPSELYYFFGFKQGILSITSNSPKFMDELLKLKDKDLLQKMPDGETFEIQVVEPSSAKLFLRRMEAVEN